jgi:hypothetical protein
MAGDDQSGHILPGVLALYLKAQLSPDRVADVEAHLEACELCVQKLSEQDKFLWCLAELSGDTLVTGGEKRRYPRVATDEPASLQVLSPFAAEAWEVRIVDVSTGGLRAITPEPLMPGALVRLNMRFSVACGDVRHCNPGDNGFQTGIRLHDYTPAPGTRGKRG